MPSATKKTATKKTAAEQTMLRAREVAGRLNVSAATVIRMSVAGTMPKPLVLKAGRALYRWDAHEISQFMAGKWRPREAA
jgi:predicted DNA-binding transcriptional regulator AlpA